MQRSDFALRPGSAGILPASLRKHPPQPVIFLTRRQTRRVITTPLSFPPCTTGPTLGALRQKLQEIARDELTRQRQRLGELTPEQERAIEALLLATVNKISHPIIRRLKNSYDAGESEDVQTWRDIFGLETGDGDQGSGDS